jgi:hypothetical protein
VAERRRHRNPWRGGAGRVATRDTSHDTRLEAGNDAVDRHGVAAERKHSRPAAHPALQHLERGPPFEGNAYESDVERFPHTLRDAIARLENGTVARELLGDEVVDHYLNYARTEQELFDQAVTCYERERMFERG